MGAVGRWIGGEYLVYKSALNFELDLLDTHLVININPLVSQMMCLGACLVRLFTRLDGKVPGLRVPIGIRVVWG